jgi:hypothetical protein
MSRKSHFIALIIFWLIACSAGTVFSQTQRTSLFSGDSTKFIGELNGLMFGLSDNDRKLVEPIMTSFVQKWNQEAFDPAKKKFIYFLCNEMLKKKIRIFPDFFNYISALNAYVDTHRPEALFTPWSTILKKLIGDKNSRNFNNFIEISNNLFTGDYLYKSQSTSWKIRPAIYTMRLDTAPVIEFSRADLICYVSKDSMMIKGTKGLFFPVSLRFNGQEGRIDWPENQSSNSPVFAELDSYQLNIRYPKLVADSARLNNKKYFSEPLLGRITNKVLVDVNEAKASYPRFVSYNRSLSIRNLFSGMDFFGGFSMEGERVLGEGAGKKDARLVVRKADQDFMNIQAPLFVIRNDRVSAASASVAIYHETDSVYHPGIEMKYLDTDSSRQVRIFSFTKDVGIKTITPWFDSWHKLEIYCEQLQWATNNDSLKFNMMPGPNKESKASFESSNYYSRTRYDKIQGIDEINILNHIKDFTDRRKTRDFTLKELSKYMQKSPEQVEAQILNLESRGFLIYDYSDKVAKVKPKLLNYVNARNGKADYDEIIFHSEVKSKSNAYLNLKTFDLDIHGIDLVVVSDSQMVALRPNPQSIKVKKDMDVEFGGLLRAGLFEFRGKKFLFEYNKFQVSMPEIDTMQFYVISRERNPATGKYFLVKVRTSLQKLEGTLAIDRPDNKAGLKSLPEYPIFYNKKIAQVYWDQKYIQKGVYKKDTFYFDVDPFTIKSLDVVRTDSLDFGGSLTSAGIFPKITQPLRVRPDYSLGFEKQTGPEGLPAYGGKGTFISRIDLSEQGLKGDGTLTYLGSTSRSGGFLFLPDSMRAAVQNFSMREQVADVEYPAVQADSVDELWMPYKDSMRISTVKKVMKMYNEQSTFTGTLALMPSLLSGDGQMNIRDAEMDSKGFRFKRRTFDALIANFRIKSYDLKDLTISTKNYQTHFDFDLRRGEFRSNIGISKVEFPINKYICSMDRFDWLIDDESITLYNEKNKQKDAESLSLAQLIDVGYTGSEFISIHPLQDSLKFFAAEAKYNLRTNVINAKEVKIIKVADAAVYPDSGHVVINKDAQMDVLRKAIIIANTKNKLHQFYQADVSIASRKNYTGRGAYDYVDRDGLRERIEFSSIRVDSSGQTVAEGMVPDTASFTLSPEFFFRGDVRLSASRKELNFDGGFKAIPGCSNDLKPEWIRFRADINPSRIMIPVQAQPSNMLSEKMMMSVGFCNNPFFVFPGFFTRRHLDKTNTDSSLCIVSGMLTYDPVTTEFRIADTARLRDLSRPGNLVSLNKTLCRMRGDGKISLSLNFPFLTKEIYGTVDHFIINDSTTARISMSMELPLTEDLVQKIAASVTSTNLGGLEIEKTPFNQALQLNVEAKELEKLRNDLSLTGKIKKLPENLEKTFFIGDVRLSYDSILRAWVSITPIGIALMGKNQVFRYVPGKMMIERKKGVTGDVMSLFLQVTTQDWYYFRFSERILEVLSSDLAFNDEIAASGTKAAKKGMKPGTKNLQLRKAQEKDKRNFLRKFEKPEE